MKMVKSLMLGSAAGLLAMGGAQAADLPVKAKAVEYVKVCSLYGAGFFYIPGTDTCIKLGGYLRVDTTFNGNIYDGPAWNGDLGAHDRYANNVNSRSRMALTVDTRTATEYGVVRTFGQGDFQFSTYGSSGSIGLASSVIPGANSGLVTPDQAGAGYVAVEMAFIQFAGFTFGKSASAYATPWHGYPGNNTSFLVGGHDTVTGINNIQYSAQFGNGVSATIGLDENSASNFNRTQVINAIGGAATAPSSVAPGAPGVFGGAAGGQIGFSGACTAYYTSVGCAYAGTYAPDVVGNIRVDQAWGMFQISAAAHQVRAGYNSNANVQTSAVYLTGFNQQNAEQSGHPDSAWGGAVMGALQIKNIPTGAGDDIKLDASYAKGATKYVLGTSSGVPSSFNMYNGNQYAMGVTSDAIYSGNSPTTCPAAPAGGLGCNGNVLTPLQLTESWGFRGAFNHNWDPYWSTSLFGGYAKVWYNQTAKQLYCNTYSANAGVAIAGGGVTHGGGTGGTFAAGSVCDPGFSIGEIGIVTRWTPVKNLTFSMEALYARLHTNMSGAITPVSAASGASAGPSSALPLSNQQFIFKDQGTASLNVRVQRNF